MGRRRATLRRTSMAWLLCSLALTGCIAGVDEEEAAGPARGAPTEVTLDCEVQGYPCSWSEASDGSLERSSQLLLETSAALDAGDDPQQVAADLVGRDDVVAVNHDATGVLLRVEGAPPVVAHTSMASPHANAFAAMAEAGSLPTQAVVSAPGASHGALVAADWETTRTPGIRPRSALLVRPWTAFDVGTFEADLRQRGLLGDDESVDPAVYEARFGTTAAVLQGSEHVRVTRDDGLSGFQSFADHDVVVVETHSSQFTCDDDRPICGPVLGGPLLSAQGDNEVLESLAGQDVDGLPPGVTFGRILGRWTLGLTADFFESTYGRTGPGEAVIVINACKTGGGDATVSGLFNRIAGLEGRRGAVFAWSRAINAERADTATAELARLMVDHAVRTDHAHQELRRQGLDEHVVGSGPRAQTARLLHLGRDVRARDAITTLVDGAPLAPEGIIRVLGEPEDAEDDVIERIALRVDGVHDDDRPSAVVTWQLPRRHEDPIELEFPLEDPKWQVVGGKYGGGRLADLRIELEDLDLEFDLRRSELVCCEGHQWIAEVLTGSTAPSRHDVDPVFLRQEVVEVLHPKLGRPMATGERVAIAGDPEDGTDEVYPLTVRVDYLDPERLEEYRLQVAVHDEEYDRAISELERIGEGRYRLDESVTLYDFPDDEEEVLVDAVLTRAGDPADQVRLDPLVLQLEYECEWGVTIDGSGTWAGDFAGHVFADGLQPFTLYLVHHEPDRKPDGTLFAQAGPGPGETGTYTADSFTFITDGRGWSGANVTLQVMENTTDRMSGTLSGTLTSGTTEGIEERPFTAEFESGDRDLDRPCGPGPG